MPKLDGDGQSPLADRCIQTRDFMPRWSPLFTQDDTKNFATALAVRTIIIIDHEVADKCD
jgi:hypothetical protein